MTPISPTLATVAVSRSAADDFHHAVAGGIDRINITGLQNRIYRSSNRRVVDRMKRGKR